jgi:regulator of sigma E protease
VQRIDYNVADTLLTELVMTKVQVRNPLVAMGIGLQKTYYFIEQVYIMMKRMVFTRSVSFDQVSGPVGIVKIGSEVASQDLTKLLYFLALISANLAVINFLPLPIVDGGLFMFLIIEKIKGSPISLRVMVATQVIGIVLIIGVFLFVTFKDLQKLFG